MRILGIETSCDETSASVVEKEKNSQNLKVLSNIIASSVSLHAKSGGIIPEVAAREQLKYIIPVIEKALKDARVSENDIDAIAVTVGPGLIGSLLVGVETAKTLSYVWQKPLIPVNHLFGHIYANFVSEKPKFPALALIVSGGHTDLVLMKGHGSWKWLGGTRDDAAGEAFDKIARLLGLSYPGGPMIEKEALKGNSRTFNFPRPMIDSKDFDFSFSGLKTAVLREVLSMKYKVLSKRTITDICSSLQQAIIDVLVSKTIKAAKQYKVKSILFGGGVSANETLRSQFILNTKYLIPNTKIFFPKKFLCTDNAAMIGSAALFNYNPISWDKLTANPELQLTS